MPLDWAIIPHPQKERIACLGRVQVQQEEGYQGDSKIATISRLPGLLVVECFVLMLIHFFIC